MEIYRNVTDATVTLELPEGVNANAPMLMTATDDVTGYTVDIKAVENGKVLYDFPSVYRSPAGYQVTVPWFLTRQDRDFYVNWAFNYLEGGRVFQVREQSYVQVVTPLISLEEVASIANLDLVTNRADVVDLERQVRYAIQSYAGQNFGKYYGVQRARGTGANRLVLPAPLLQFSAFSFDGILRPNYGIVVTNGGWALSGGEIEINSIKQAPPEWMLDRFDYVGKIYAPLSYAGVTFREGVEYVVEGLWGYPEVPGDVTQAARLLVQDYSCDESLWRDRYIKSIQAGDWRLQFSDLAFVGTGNVQADQILSGYRRQTMAVI